MNIYAVYIYIYIYTCMYTHAIKYTYHKWSKHGISGHLLKSFEIYLHSGAAVHCGSHGVLGHLRGPHFGGRNNLRCFFFGPDIPSGKRWK